MINVYINGVNCPIVNDDSIVITKKIVDIENPEQKQIDHSKGFLIQNTAAVTTLFGSIFEVNIEIQNTSTTNFNTDFNPNLKAKCVVMNDNAVVLSGYCQMLDIVILDGNKIAYNINCYGNIGNFFNDIKNLKLTDLDLSDLNQDWTRTNVVNSWTPTLGTGIVYPLIDYGLTETLDKVSTTQFRPAIFVKDLIDRIFLAAGWNYSSAFFTSTRFKSLIIPFTEEKLLNSNTVLANRRFAVGRDTSQAYASGAWTAPNSQPKISISQDTGSIAGYAMQNDSFTGFSLANDEWTCTESGTYEFGVYMEYYQTIVAPAIGGLIPQSSSFAIVAVVEVGGTRYYKNYVTATATYQLSTTSDNMVINQTMMGIHVNAGEKVYFICANFQLQSRVGTYRSNANGEMDITMGKFIVACNSTTQIEYGDSVNINDILPIDVRQTDLISSIGKMFNLYFEQTNDKTLLIEPREDYFTGTTVDWTTKIDIGQEVKLTPMGMSQKKRYLFNYESDTDWLNNLYQTAYKENYGTYKEDINTDFLTETKEIKPIFANTPLHNFPYDDKIVSCIKFVDQDGIIKQGQSKIRILYWGGLISCKTWLMYESAITSGGGSSKTSYPYAGHLDSPKAPTFDLCFGAPEAVHYDGTLGAQSNPTYTDNNLFNYYWKQTIKELTNKNSKVLEAWFYLNLADFISLSFRSQYFIKDAYYRLIEVNDYDISGTKLVKCKLLKVDREAAHTSSSKTLWGGDGLFDSGKKLPVRLYPDYAPDGNSTIKDKFKGNTNFVAGSLVTVKGNNNQIPTGATGVTVMDSDDTIVESDRVMMFNSDGVTMTRPGAILNGVLAEYKNDFTVDDTYLKAIDGGVGATVLPSLAANEHYQITRFYLEIGAGTTNYTWTGSGDITIETSTGSIVGTITGVSWLGLGLGTVAVGTVADSWDFGDDIVLKIAGTWLGGDRDIRFIIFNKIIIL